MTLDEVIQQPVYWALLVLCLTAGTLSLNVRVLDFRFVAMIFLSQYVAHTIVATGFSSLSWFAVCSWGSFIVGAVVVRVVHGRRPSSAMTGTMRLGTTLGGGADGIWSAGARLFLTAYWAVHLVVLPPTFGAVDIQQRLEQRETDAVISYLGALVLPALAACMWVWLRRGYRLRWFDCVPLVLSIVGMLGSTSKVSVLPLVLAFAGVSALRRKPLREMRLALVGVAIATVALSVRLVFYYPDGSPLVALRAIAYRLAANTDSVDYLVRSGLNPGDYPFAGPGALLPFVTKRLGYAYEFGPGVWLYGVTTGNYHGFGPNPGILMDYFANLGWIGLLVPFALAAAVALVVRSSSAVAASLTSVIWLAFVDVQLFELALVPQVLVLGLVHLLFRMPFTRPFMLRISRRLMRKRSRRAASIRIRVPQGPLKSRRPAGLHGRHRAAAEIGVLPGSASSVLSGSASPLESPVSILDQQSGSEQVRVRLPPRGRETAVSHPS